MIDNNSVEQELLTGALTGAGWRVAVAADSATMQMGCPALVLVGDADLAAVAAIRSLGGAMAAVPILAWTGDDRPVPGADDHVAKPCPAHALVAAAERWRPPDEAVLDRLEASFGTAAMRSLWADFAVSLEQALAALADGTARSVAHRVAGSAGTLGFADAGAAWLAVSHGDDSAAADARRHARLALAAIARRVR